MSDRKVSSEGEKSQLENFHGERSPNFHVSDVQSSKRDSSDVHGGKGGHCFGPHSSTLAGSHNGDFVVWNHDRDLEVCLMSQDFQVRKREKDTYMNAALAPSYNYLLLGFPYVWAGLKGYICQMRSMSPGSN
ncbi:hypothetical protein TorRG33x02_303230 [Trema orientale]|uniref:Uncharacterized protein n=1 Tax=Trema orientale TaxID=63057 RepID=A0A2P5BZN4_TREOI|nr:hypothetical protein TorRG33x02_303230 [Trema orientale]